MTSEIVTGAAALTTSFTSCRVASDLPSDPSTTRVFMNRRYCFQTGSSRWYAFFARSTASGGRLRPGDQSVPAPPGR